eukprot:5848216-Lingulodinium_polyedra.AAC.1
MVRDPIAARELDGREQPDAARRVRCAKKAETCGSKHGRSFQISAKTSQLGARVDPAQALTDT